MFRSLLTVTVIAVAFSHPAIAQRRLPGGTPSAGADEAAITLVARVGAKSYTGTLSGSCQHEPDAAIYDLPSALWTVQAGGAPGNAIKQLNLTLWRPKNGSADQISLSLQAGTSSTRIEINPRDRPMGAVKVTLESKSSGGTFDLTGKDAKGKKVKLTIGCPTFDAIVAEGG